MSVCSFFFIKIIDFISIRLKKILIQDWIFDSSFLHQKNVCGGDNKPIYVLWNNVNKKKIIMYY